ncbi:hypothetical protein DL96DRAFT_1773948 [Flagelloscypha sp. PMI_526]|nr:hypothetical protein DL96DRAFT_1773948 [Flagelloscypha sp. PMI_526]
MTVDDPGLKQALKTFLATLNASEESFNIIRDAAKERHPEDHFPSFESTQQALAELTGISPIQHDMCPNSCAAYTGPFATLDSCPFAGCNESRWEPDDLERGIKTPRRKFWTIPLGPYLQALWRDTHTAEELKYRRELDEKIKKMGHKALDPDEWDDIFCGHDYVKLVLEGKIKPTDMVVMFSIDGAQLYPSKPSDCWIYIWVILDLRPGIRYGKKYVVPGGFIGGPNPPKIPESYTLPGFHHLAILQKEGLPIWDSSLGHSPDANFISHIWLLLSTADGPGQQHMSGANGHTARIACRFFCRMLGRHRLRAPQYYPALLRPTNSAYPDTEQDDISVSSLRTSPSSPDSHAAYNSAMLYLLESTSTTDYRKRQTQCGFGKVSILNGLSRTLSLPGVFPGDLMHYVLNIGDLLIGLWRGTAECIPPDNRQSWDWAVLDGDIWKAHSSVVAASGHFLPDCYDRPPRNPAEKMNSRYKAKEWQHWLFGLGPGHLYGVLPQPYWQNFCKLVHVIRILHQRKITKEELVGAYEQISSFAVTFELLYYRRRLEHLHFVRQSIHTPLHMVHEVCRLGNPVLYAQWTLERTIGNLAEELHQHKNPYALLSQRGLYRAQINALKAMDPSFDPQRFSEIKVPQGGKIIGDSYMLLPAKDRSWHEIATESQRNALSTYLNERRDVNSEIPVDFKITRWARLRIPDVSQTARSSWRETASNRVTRMVKALQYFFRYTIDGQAETLAMVSVFSPPDKDLLHQSSGSLWAAHYRGADDLRVIEAKSIQSVVAMIPFPLKGNKRGQDGDQDRKGAVYM